MLFALLPLILKIGDLTQSNAESWTKLNHRCRYYFDNSDIRNQSESSNKCESLYGHLPNIIHNDQLSDIKATVKSKKVWVNGVTVGSSVNCRSKDECQGKFKWNTHEHFFANDPWTSKLQFEFSGDGKCVYLEGNTLKNAACEDNFHTVCQANCSKIWIAVDDGASYHYGKVSKNYDGAKQYCRKMGSFLVRPKTYEQTDSLKNYTEQVFENTNGFAWVGLERNSSTSTDFQYVDGTRWDQDLRGFSRAEFQNGHLCSYYNHS